MGSFLAECQGCVPLGVTGVDLETFSGVDQSKSRNFCVPGLGSDQAGGIKGFLMLFSCGLRPGQLAGLAGG